MLLKNFSILYVEDDTDMQEYMKAFLEDEVKEFYQAYNGEEGLVVYKDKKPDIILSDIYMPKMNGLEMSTVIKTLDKTQPIIFLSAFEDVDILEEAINISIDSFIVKPIRDIHNLITILENISLNLQNKIDAIQMRKELEKLTERLELANWGSQDGIWDWNILDNSVYFSPRWKEILGYSDEELVNEVSTWTDRVHPDDIEEAWAGIYENINSKTKYYEGVHRLRHKDGHWVWILDRGKAIYDKSGKAVRMIGTHTDISIDKAYQLKYEHQAQIIEQIHDSVTSTDLDGVITSWNNGAELLLGYTEDEAIGQNIAMLY
ncbi:MAG: PAS domain-containing protein, partial [Sulfurimonas sp.]|nr:PAS domain-containing protein [Sulfurimonas sp.]